jgi:hypothetical protein
MIASVCVVAAVALYGFRTSQRAHAARVSAPAPVSGPC